MKKRLIGLPSSQCMAVKKSVLGITGLAIAIVLSGCATQHCDPTGAMAGHCAPVKMHVWTGEAFEEDKIFFYKRSDDTGETVRHIPATALAERVLKGQKDYHQVWSNDGSRLKAVFVKRPASF